MNINEIARLSGVSRATVSRYLNNGYVSDEKKEKIREVIEETGYKPSSQAQMLRTKKTNLIGVIIPKINSDSVSRMMAGISRELKDAGYQLLLANTDNDEKEEIKYLKVLAENHVDGIILIGTVFTASHKKILKELSVPVVILGQCLSGYSCVYYDDYGAAYEVSSLLMKRGKCPAYIGVTERDEATGRRRKEGFYRAAADCQIAIKPACVAIADFSMEAGYEQMGRLFLNHSEIDSIFCATDRIAVGALRWLLEHGKRIPQDIQVAGIGDSDMAKVCVPKLTTVHYFYKTSGGEAARLLVDILKTGNQAPRHIKMGYKMVFGESTGLSKS